MTKVYITRSFEKEIKDKPVLRALLVEIKKHSNGAKNLIDLYSPGKDLKVLKAYLSSKKIRSAILLRISKKIYIPFFIAKKETKAGWNLSKYSEDILFLKISKIYKEIKNKKYKEYQF